MNNKFLTAILAASCALPTAAYDFNFKNWSLPKFSGFSAAPFTNVKANFAAGFKSFFNPASSYVSSTWNTMSDHQKKVGIVGGLTTISGLFGAYVIRDQYKSNQQYKAWLIKREAKMKQVISQETDIFKAKFFGGSQDDQKKLGNSIDNRGDYEIRTFINRNDEGKIRTTTVELHDYQAKKKYSYQYTEQPELKVEEIR